MGNSLSLPNIPGLHDEFNDSAIQEAILNYIFSSEARILDEILQLSKPRQKRIKLGRCKDFGATQWGLMLANPLTADPDSYFGKKFRRRFRVPYIFFKDILVPMCEKANVFEVKRQSSIPVEYKILVALRMLGRADVADTSAELSHIGETTCSVIFRQFVTNFAREFETTYIKFPEGEELHRVMEIYRKLGIPGATSSMDGVHVSWGNAPSDVINECSGKEKYPTLAWMVMCDHNHRVTYVSKEVYCSANDINLCH